MLRILAAAFCCLVLIGCSGESDADGLDAVAPGAGGGPINVVLIVAKNLGAYDTTILPSGLVATPNLSRLAAQGVTFSTAYSASSASGPARAALLSGAKPHYLGFEYENADPRDSAERGREAERGLPEDVVILPEMFRKGGYRTAAVGLWHLGGASPVSLKYPVNRGFDEFYGITGTSTPYTDISLPDVAFAPSRSYSGSPTRFGDNRIVQGSGAAAVESQRYATFDFAEQAIDFIDRTKANPFFLYLAFNAADEPLQAPDQLVNTSTGTRAPGASDVRAGMIRALDQAVGMLIRGLANRGLLERTLIIFTSDAGCSDDTLACQCGALRGTAPSLFDGGLRVPLVMRGPGLPKAGTVIDAPVSTLDIAPTLKAMLSLQAPLGMRLQGQSLTALFGKSTIEERPLVWTRRPAKALRLGRYKLIESPQTEEMMLFDLEADPGERENIAQREPNMLLRMRAQLEVNLSDSREPLWLSRETAVLDGCGPPTRIYR